MLSVKGLVCLSIQSWDLHSSAAQQSQNTFFLSLSVLPWKIHHHILSSWPLSLGQKVRGSLNFYGYHYVGGVRWQSFTQSDAMKNLYSSNAITVKTNPAGRLPNRVHSLFSTTWREQVSDWQHLVKEQNAAWPSRVQAGTLYLALVLSLTAYSIHSHKVRQTLEPGT